VLLRGARARLGWAVDGDVAMVVFSSMIVSGSAEGTAPE
jgi:hypothetical protein